MSTRVRGPNFCEQEKAILLTLVKEYRHVVDNKKTDGDTTKLKNRTWQIIAESFNDLSSTGDRSPDQLRVLYDNLKRRAKAKCKTQDEYQSDETRWQHLDSLLQASPPAPTLPKQILELQELQKKYQELQEQSASNSNDDMFMTKQDIEQVMVPASNLDENSDRPIKNQGSQQQQLPLPQLYQRLILPKPSPTASSGGTHQSAPKSSKHALNHLVGQILENTLEKRRCDKELHKVKMQIEVENLEAARIRRKIALVELELKRKELENHQSVRSPSPYSPE